MQFCIFSLFTSLLDNYIVVNDIKLDIHKKLQQFGRIFNHHHHNYSIPKKQTIIDYIILFISFLLLLLN